GGNAPASVNGTLRPDGTTYNGPAVPALTNIQQVLPDLLFRIEKGGYYGHPNPVRGEYVLFGGNPTAGDDPAQINAYPVGTLPDSNWKGFAFNFDLNKSANGVIEYKSNVFNGALKGKLIVTRFSQNKDLITLTPGSDLNIESSIEGLAIPGFSGFVDPLDLIEDTRNGNIYVSEYARSEATKGNISLLRPVEKSNIASSVKELIFSGLKTNISPPKVVPLKNNGTSALTITGLNIEGKNSTSFELKNVPAFPITLQPQEVLNIEVIFNPSGSVGSLEAMLKVFTNNSTLADLNIGLYGLSANGLEGNNEPPLHNIITTLGYKINVGGTALELSTGSELIGDEVYAQLFQKVGAGNVEIIPVARYSPLEQLPFGFYHKQNDNIELTQVGVLSGETPQHQTLFPQMLSGNNFFNPGTKIFGIYTKSTSKTHTTYTEDFLNPGNGPNNGIKHLVRVYPLKDRQGKAISNSYLLGFEEAMNGDYQDYVFIIKNVRPVPNAAPTLSSISNPAAIPSGSGQQTINLTGITAGEGDSQSISISATSSNPGLIPNPSVQYQSPGSTGILTYTPVAGASGSAEITVTVTDSGPNVGAHENTLIRTFIVDVNGPNNNAPTLDSIDDPAPIKQDAPAQVVNLTGISAGEGEEDQIITVTVTSDNPGLIPEPVVDYSSPNSTGTLTYTPATGASGFATITVTVTDNGVSDEFNVNSFSQSFVVEVGQVNETPSISEIADQHIEINEVMGPISFTIADEDTDVIDLEIEAISDNQSLVPDGSIVFGGSGANRTISLTPNSDESGEALITVYVYDGFTYAERSFTVYVGTRTSIDEGNSNNNVKLYPNPAYSEVTLVVDNSKIGQVDIGILDLAGKVRHNMSVHKQEASMRVNINIDHLPKGVYILRINQNGFVSSRRLIKL
ncbi:MAG: Ig-like domain-containing protein, partial [Bacteroidota bacterium]|nr:Ig-like domain-containing protein [Bacteroidota bacterium]